MRSVVTPYPSLGDKMRRALWNVAWLLLYRPSPVMLHGWRRFLLRRFGAKVGAGARPYPTARIWAPWHLEMGEGSMIGSRSEVYTVARVTLGAWSVISQRAFLCTASHDVHAPGFALTAAPISIGRNAWIAAGAFIGPGVTMAEGAVAAACAVVIRDVGRGVIVGGNPAVAIGESGLADFPDGSMWTGAKAFPPP